MKLGIFARTFLLTAAALFIAIAVGAVLLVHRPPQHDAPMRLSEIARHLSGAWRDAVPPPPEMRTPVRPPPDARHGPPPPGLDRPGATPGMGRRESFRVRMSSLAPDAPQGTNDVASAKLRAQLAVLLGVQENRVRLYAVDGALPRHMRPDNPELRDGFVAAWRDDDGQWRIMERTAKGFPDSFQRQLMWLVAIGLLILLPVSWLFARTLSAPIRRFAEGARRLGTDPHAPALARSGTPEMLDAIDSFNAMQGRVSRLLQERSQMIGAIAHDLRTPLMRLAFRLDDLQSPLREKVEADIEEMKLMISAALDFVRDQAAGGSRERLDLRLLVESVVDDQVDVGHDVTVAAGEGVPIHGDPVALRRMVVNLVDNALKYGERARLRLRVQGDRIVLEVDDDGPGIPEVIQQRVFEPFFRAETSRNRDTGGIGLGLTTVRAIVLDHGGQIELRNRKDGGLRVIVTLPVRAG